jgi:hypothetical protein
MATVNKPLIFFVCQELAYLQGCQPFFEAIFGIQVFARGIRGEISHEVAIL